MMIMFPQLIVVSLSKPQYLVKMYFGIIIVIRGVKVSYDDMTLRYKEMKV